MIDIAKTIKIISVYSLILGALLALEIIQMVVGFFVYSSGIITSILVTVAGIILAVIVIMAAIHLQKNKNWARITLGTLYTISIIYFLANILVLMSLSGGIFTILQKILIQNTTYCEKILH